MTAGQLLVDVRRAANEALRDQQLRHRFGDERGRVVGRCGRSDGFSFAFVNVALVVRFGHVQQIRERFFGAIAFVRLYAGDEEIAIVADRTRVARERIGYLFELAL